MTEDPSKFGYGQQTPQVSNSDYNVLNFVVDQLLGRISTVRLVKVTSVSATSVLTGNVTVDVQPLVNQVDGQGNATPHGTIFGIPVAQMQGGGAAISVVPKVGDTGILLVCDRDISAVKSARQQSNPGSGRRFDMADGIYLGGVLNSTPANKLLSIAEDGIRAVFGGATLQLTEALASMAFGAASMSATAAGMQMAFGSNSIGLGAAGITIGAGSTINFGGANFTNVGSIGAASVSTTGDVAATGAVTSNSGAHTLGTHVHGGISRGSALSDAPTG